MIFMAKVCRFQSQFSSGKFALVGSFFLTQVILHSSKPYTVFGDRTPNWPYKMRIRIKLNPHSLWSFWKIGPFVLIKLAHFYTRIYWTQQYNSKCRGTLCFLNPCFKNAWMQIGRDRNAHGVVLRSKPFLKTLTKRHWQTSPRSTGLHFKAVAAASSDLQDQKCKTQNTKCNNEKI